MPVFDVLRKTALGAVLVPLALLSGAFAAEIDSQLRDFETSVETKLKENLGAVRGDKPIFAVYVHAIRAPKKSEDKGKQIDLGYLPVPYDMDAQGTITATEEKLEISTLDVEVQVPGAVDDPLRKAVDEVVQKTLKGYNPKVTVTSITPPVLPLDYRPYLPLAAALLGALIVALGIVGAAFALKRASLSISEGFLSLKTSEINASKPKDDTKKETEKKKAEEKPVSPEVQKVSLAPAEKALDQNIRLIEKIIKEQPALFVRSVTDDDDDNRGIRWLLPKLADDVQQILQGAFGSQRMAHIAGLQTKPDQLFNYTVWIQLLSEQIIVRKIQGGSVVERVLGPEKTLKLMTSPAKSVLAAAAKIDTNASWRIAAEFVPSDEFQGALGTAGEDRWQKVISGAMVKEDELGTAADALLGELSTAGGDAGDDDTARAKEKYYSEQLLEPVVKAVKTKPLGEDDIFLDQIGTKAPDFVTLVRSRVWTPSVIARVPEQPLGRAVMRMTNEQRAALVVGMPKEYSDKVMALVPEGNAKTILLDRIKKLMTKADANKSPEVIAICRDFLDILKADHDSGKFALAAAATDEAPSNVTPINQARKAA